MDKRWCILTDALPHELTVGKERFPIDVRTSTALNCLRKLRGHPRRGQALLPAQAPRTAEHP